SVPDEIEPVLPVDGIRTGHEVHGEAAIGSHHSTAGRRNGMTDGFPQEGMELTHILVSHDPDRARDFYVDVLGAELYRQYGSSVVLRLMNNWLLLVEGGGPTEDKP